MKYKAVFFDAGNTLLTPYPSVESVCADVFARNGFTFAYDAISEAVAHGDAYYEKRYWADDTFWASEEASEAMWLDLYSAVAGKLGVNGDRRRLAREIYDEFGNHTRWRLFPDAEGVLEPLKARGLTLGIVSNWDSRLADLCAGIGITEQLDFVVSSTVVGRMKPQPEIFEMALSRAGVVPGEALHVGDHYYADVLGARSVGIEPVLIDRLGRTAATGFTTISGLRQLLDIVDVA